MNTEHLMNLLSEYRYLILLPLAIVEGPIVAIVAGWLCREEILNIPMTFLTLILGDLIGDSLVFGLSRSTGGRVNRLVHRLHWDRGNPQKIRGWIDHHPLKSIALSKLTLGIGPIGLFVVGRSGLSYARFLKYVFLVALAQYCVYLLLGYCFGTAYRQISGFLDDGAAVMCIALVFVLSLYLLHRRRRLL